MKFKLNKNLFLSIFLFFGLVNIVPAQIWVNYNTNDDLIDGAIYGIAPDQDGNIWFSSWTNPGGDFTFGLSKFDGTDFTTFTTADGLPSDTVYSLLLDSNDNLWAGTAQGLAKYNGTNWTTINDDLVGKFVWSILEDNDNNIWISSYNSQSTVLSIFDGNTWSTLNESRGTYDILQSSDGSIWTCDNDGVHKYDGTNWITYNESNGLSSNLVFDMFFDNENNLWVGNATDTGLDKFDGTNWTTYTVADGLVDNNVRAFFQHPNGDIWFGTNAGISVFDGTTWTTLDTNDGLIENHVRSFYQDANGEIWIGTWEGVSRLLEPVNVEKIEANSDIKVFPNPTASILQIESDELNLKKVTFFDALGREIFTRNLTHNFIDIASLETGNYIVLFEDSNGKFYSHKVLKN